MIFVKSFKEPDFRISEVLRYAGVHGENEEMVGLVKSLVEETREAFSYKVCYSIFPVSIKGDRVDFDSFFVNSKKLALNLKNASRAVVFAATLGVGIDRLINKYSKISPSKALLLQALGTERIEALCDEFCKSIGEKTYPRFSAGYGDLSLECQKDIFTLLDCEKNIGLTLNDSMLMSPMKSVTAFMGLKEVE